MIAFTRHEGGREEAGYHGQTGDCAVRAASIASGVPYAEVYEEINTLAKNERPRGGKKRSSARTGVWPRTLGRFLERRGFRWVPTMSIGSGTRVHLRADELPSGRLVCRLSRHYAAVLDGVLYDLGDCSRDGTRAVYGYWIKDTDEETDARQSKDSSLRSSGATRTGSSPLASRRTGQRPR